MMLSTLPTDRTPARPVALVVKPENIPAELKARRAWVCWHYDLNKSGKWTKVPYTPGTARKAKSNTSSTWGTFDEALACYRERRDFFDGIGFCPSKKDPFVLGDVDHTQSTDRLPPTYAETSPGGNGSRWVAIASGDYHAKKPNGEVYSYSQFMTITGHVLPGHEVITQCQEAVEAFAASLGPSSERRKGSGAGNGNRAEHARAVPESEWEAGRHLLRTQRQNLLGRVTAAAGEETQLALILAGDYAEFHRRWSHVGLFRDDGTLDVSQVRAVAASGIKPRNFTFPEYCAIMSALYAADALAKWGTKEAWRAELVALWNRSPEPKYTRRAKPRIKLLRGRAGNHAALVEQVYQQLLDRRAGDEAIVTARQIADVMYCARETVARIFKELRDGGRISTERLPRHGGMVVTFLDVMYSKTEQPVCPIAAPEIERSAVAIEETEHTQRVSSQTAGDNHSLPTLRDLAAHYLDQPAPDIGQRLVSQKTGQITYRRTASHFAELVTLNYGDVYLSESALDAYAAEKQHRKDEAAKEWQRFFNRLKQMPDDELMTYIAGRCRTEVHELARDGSPFDKHLYRVRLKCARQQLAWRGLTMPVKGKRTDLNGASDKRLSEVEKPVHQTTLDMPQAMMPRANPILDIGTDWSYTERCHQMFTTMLQAIQSRAESGT